MKHIFVIVLFIVLFTSLYGQDLPPDSVKMLESFTVTSSRLSHFSAGTKQISLDSNLLQQHIHQNLGDMLSNESHIYIKSYGSGSLASASFRGSNAHHTAVLWNGININSPMNGQMDFSLLPVGLFDGVHIQYGGSSSLWGSGAMGGAIHLSNKALFNKGLKATLTLSAGSFANLKQSTGVLLSKKRMLTSLKIFNSSSKNDFEYTNVFLNTKPLMKQSNAEISGKGLMSETHFLIKDNQKVNFLFWYQHSDRNIPPTMAEAQSKAHQTDDNLKLSSEWAFFKHKATAFIRGAFFNDVQNYDDSITQIYALNSFLSAIAEGEIKIDYNINHHFNFGLNNTYIAAKATNLPSEPKQNNTAFFVSYGFLDNSQNLRFNVSARQEWMKEISIPLTYSAGATFQLLKSIALYAQVAKVYRLPTLNDLYWQPGGNPKLLPEDGYTHEIGFRWQYKYRNLQMNISPSLFSNRINNWIMWLPEGNFWRPHNIMEVWSRGLETHSEIKWQHDDVSLGVKLLTNYVLSGNQKARSDNDNSVDKQLIYVPMYSGYARFDVGYKSWQCAFRQNYTGYRYTSSDNTQYLEPYTLSTLYLNYKLGFKKAELYLFAQCHNVFNTSYQVIALRPMPLRYFSFGTSINFNKPNL